MADSHRGPGQPAGRRGQLSDAQNTYQQIHDALQAVPQSRQQQSDLAVTRHHLGVMAQLRGRLDEAQEWYTRSLAIEEELGNRPGMALTRAQRALLAEQQGHPEQALREAIRSVALFEDIPDPHTGTAPARLARLTAQLGVPAVEAAWREVTGSPLPQAVRGYITSAPPSAGPTS